MDKKVKKSTIRGVLGTQIPKGPVITSVKDIDDPNTKGETVIGISGTRMVFADYPLIQHDFPHLSDEVLNRRFKKVKRVWRRAAINNHIDDWILRNTSYLSERQAEKVRVNTPAPRTNHRVKAFRPTNYGRALVYSVRENAKTLFDDRDYEAMGSEDRLLDVKGVGVSPVRTPSNNAHSNGLFKLSDAIGEFLMQQVIQLVLEHSGAEVSTVPVYAVVDLGIDLQSVSGQKLPLGMIIRRAHRRQKRPGGLYPYGSDGQHVQLAIELLLRKYGITSVNNASTAKVWKEDGDIKIEYGGSMVNFNKNQRKTIEEVSHIKRENRKLTFLGINVQHTRDINLDPLKAQLVDFGSYSVKDRFRHPILSLVSDKLLRWGGTIWPRHNRWVQPYPHLRIPFEYWGASGKILGYEGHESDRKVDVLSTGLAMDFRANRISREMMQGVIQAYLNTVTSKWSEIR